MTEETGKKSLFSVLKSEILDNIMLTALLLLGVKNRSDIENKSGKMEKQVPDWFLSAFPNLTRDDDNEYNLTLDSHPNPNAQVAAKEFRKNMIQEGIHDDVRYVVDLIKIRREFLERTKNPAPEDKSGGRLTFGNITLNDSVNAFFSELLAEKNIGGTDEEIYDRQKDRAKERNLLPKKHFLKKAVEWSRDHKAETLVGIILFPFVLFQLIIWLLGG